MGRPIDVRYHDVCEFLGSSVCINQAPKNRNANKDLYLIAGGI